MVRNIIAELSLRKPNNLFVWTVTGKTTKVHFNSVVNHLYLAIRLGMVGRRESLGPTEAK